MSPLDSDIRGVILAPAALLIAAGLGFETAGGVLALTLAVALWITAFTGHCPVYDLFGASESQTA